MKIYLASRYGRREELLGYAKDLEEMGHEITSRWITGIHEIPGRSESVSDRNSYTEKERAHFAQEAIEDIEEADTLIAFTNPDNSSYSRGGCHVEFGYALAKKKQIIVIGPRENVFHCLPEAWVFATWERFLTVLERFSVK